MEISKENIEKVIVETANSGIKMLDIDGRMPAGRNGPHNHRMTPVRNTAHWTITLLKAYKVTNDDKFKRSAIKSLSYLMSKEAKPGNGSFLNRSEPGSNRFNGLIGQAWVFEALYYATESLNDDSYKEYAKKVHKLHIYNSKEHLYHQLDIDGMVLGIEYTLNQQIWFAALESMLFENEKNCWDFLNNLPKKINLRRHGMLRNFILGSGIYGTLKWNIKSLLKYGLYAPNLDEIQSAYHIFALVGLTYLFKKFPSHNFWYSRKFNSILSFILSPEYKNLIKLNRFGYPYNITGFEIPYVMLIFRDFFKNHPIVDRIREEIELQFDLHYDFKKKLMTQNTSDPDTLAARFYEIVRFSDEDDFWELMCD